MSEPSIDESANEALPPGHGDDPANRAQKGLGETVGVDTKYRSYMTHYANLDGLIWRNISIGASITAIAIGLIGSVLQKRNFSIPPLSHDGTISLIFAILSIYYYMIVYILWRMRFNHRKIEEQLAKMEREGYFAERKSSSYVGWLSATFIVGIVFFCVGTLCIVYSTYMAVYGEVFDNCIRHI